MRITFSRTRVYEVTAFVTGFVLMVFELVASRMLAPTIGSSTYIWTSVIGVIIAALSLGYTVGGWLADKRVARHDIGWLLLATAGCIAVTLVFSDGILSLLSEGTWDARLKGLAASILLFLPASFVLGVISPYLVRLHTDSLTVAGRSVASLSALNAIGGIVGTFSAGFIFFSFMGSRQTLCLLIGLLLLMSWTLLPRYHLRIRIIITAFLAIACLDSLVPRTSAATLAVIDTPSAHYKVISTMFYDAPIHALVTGPRGWQSGVYTQAPDSLVFNYTKGMADVVAAAPQRNRILVLGGGAFTLPQYVAKQYPASQIDVVEIDPKLVDISKQYFHYQSPPNVHIIADDARAFLGYTKEKYDIVVVDVYSDINVPFAVATTEYTQALRSALRPNGIVAANIIGGNGADCKSLLGAIHSSYMAHFSQYRAYPMLEPTLTESQNIIVVYGNRKLDWANAIKREAVPLRTGRELHDNFAPIEHIGYSCWN
jgi:spermidine synthase